MKTTTKRRTTYEAWRDEAIARFGADPMDWQFVCPSCGYVARISDWHRAGATDGEVAFSCIGRALGARVGIGTEKGPCNYAGDGLLRLNPVTVEFSDGSTVDLFEFAPSPKDM